jgi:phosphotransferase system IIB component
VKNMTIQEFIQNNLLYIGIGAAVLILVVVLFVVLKKRSQKVAHEDRVEKSNKLIDLLGGFSNIVHYEFRGSRFKVELKDLSLAQKEEIQALGANGIMEVNNTLQIILGNESKKLKTIIEDLNK